MRHVICFERHELEAMLNGREVVCVIEGKRHTCVSKEAYTDNYSSIHEGQEQNKDNEVIFKCRKCQHNLYVEDFSHAKADRIASMDCPECGEEGCENWVLIGAGNYEKEHGGR